MKSPTDGWNVEMPETPELRERADRAGSEAERDIAGAWRDLKSRFVDDPAAAIAAAEELLRGAVNDRIRALNHEAAALCARDRGEDPSSTEEMRARLLRYQTYCEQLASSRHAIPHS
jgi:hypothetical protein